MSAAQPATERKRTKIDTNRLCDQIKSCYIINKPLDYRGMETFNVCWRQALAEKRLLIVMTGLQGWLTTAKERVAKNQAHDAYFKEQADNEIHSHLWRSSPLPESSRTGEGTAQAETVRTATSCPQR